MLALLLAACTGAVVDSSGEPPDTADSAAATGPGTLAISVKMEDDLLVDLAADGETAIAMVSGEVYAEADVNPATGPLDGVVALGEFAVDVDLSIEGGPSPVVYTTDPLDPQIVYVLGCLDSDLNGDCGDAGDPVTFPTQNKFQVAAGVESPITMELGLRRPSDQ